MLWVVAQVLVAGETRGVFVDYFSKAKLHNNNRVTFERSRDALSRSIQNITFFF